MAAKKTYRAVFGHVEVLPGTRFESRMEVKAAGLHKANQDGISWGLDPHDKRAADAIVLSNGYEDDRDLWDEVIYTGAGGRDANTGHQVEDQTWENPGNASLRRSRESAYSVRVIRGSDGEEVYSPTSGYRYDGLYRVLSEWTEDGKSGFQICRFKLRRLSDENQELTPMEQQIKDVIDGAPRRQTTTVERIVRDTAVAQRIKRLYGYTCQICSLALAVGPDGLNYAEGAHIQALGKPNNGPDVDGNVLCLCPNCHVKLDRGALYLTDGLNVVDRFPDGSRPRITKLTTVERHEIRKRFVRAHRRYWGVVNEEEG
ncbi:YDG/SRA domain-containing protein [Streptomyces sp. NPDC050433]|uniref:YDG/SRA domain-containing protein n=1 Tax=Streptomyces sp. NPDC050433 TaxID=3365615 RepID=UPI0037B766DC